MAEQTKVITIVLSENAEGGKFLSYYGNMPMIEALAYCQEIIVNDEKNKAVEDYKKRLENAN